MASLRAQLFNLFLRATTKSRSFLSTDPSRLRVGVDKRAIKRPPKGVKLERVEEGGVRGEWHRSELASEGRTLLYFHGGGYVFGSSRSHRSVTFPLAKKAVANVFSLDYRLAPENPFPAAVEDALAGYEWLIDNGVDISRLAVAGDSAGGGLALALLIALRDRDMPLPACSVLYSPWTDLAVTGASINENENVDVMFNAVGIRNAPSLYLNGSHPETPLASPLYAELSGLPPLMVFASKSEILRDDSTRLVDKANVAGVETEMILRDGLAHVWPIFHGHFREAVEDIDRSAAFIRKHTFNGTA